MLVHEAKRPNPKNAVYQPSAAPMVGQRRRRWPNIGPTSGWCIVFAGTKSRGGLIKPVQPVAIEQKTPNAPPTSPGVRPFLDPFGLSSSPSSVRPPIPWMRCYRGLLRWGLGPPGRRPDRNVRSPDLLSPEPRTWRVTKCPICDVFLSLVVLYFE